MRPISETPSMSPVIALAIGRPAKAFAKFMTLRSSAAFVGSAHMEPPQRSLSLRLIDIDYVHGHGGRLAVAPDGEIDGPADADPFELMRQVERAADGDAIGGGDDVALRPAVRIRAPQARALGGRAGPDPGDDDAVDARRRWVIGRNDADARRGYPPVGDELGNDPAHGVDRNGKSSAVLGALS
jgi:hypothetical protein